MNLNCGADPRIAVIGLGYVGLSLATSLANRYRVSGYDLDNTRIRELTSGYDRNGQVDLTKVEAGNLEFVDNISGTKECKIFIIAVPTPVDEKKQPNLIPLKAATTSVGEIIKHGDIVVYESTVFPGTTEEICGPIIERCSGMRCGQDFFLGYSPERVNPGDKLHTLEKVIKVVSGQTPEVAEYLGAVYGAVIPAGIHITPDIRTAEAAKAIENAQRDINIAFINEVTKLFHQLDLESASVLEAARTKWNFLDFNPGLVGGHCIGVDPYYLAHVAATVGIEPEIILAGRRINDGMANFIAEEVDQLTIEKSRILVMGLTFKENVVDLRNSQVINLISALSAKGHFVDAFDPVCSREEVWNEFQLKTLEGEKPSGKYNAVIGAVAHDQLKEISLKELENLIEPKGLLVDLKGIWPSVNSNTKLRVWRL